MSHRTVLSLVVVLTIISLLAACGPTPEPETIVQTVEVEKTVVETVEVEVPVEPTRPAGETIRIGGVGPLSAPGTVVGGIAMQFAMNLAVKDINEAGGVSANGRHSHQLNQCRYHHQSQNQQRFAAAVHVADAMPIY